MDNFKVVCVNDRAKPDGFIGDWVQKNQIYTVIDAKYLERQHMSVGYKIAELKISEESMYQFFLANRFRPLSENDEHNMEEAFQELLEEEEGVDVSTLIKEEG